MCNIITTLIDNLGYCIIVKRVAIVTDMDTPNDSKATCDRGALDTTNLRHPGVSPNYRPESPSLSASALVTGGNLRLRDVPAGRAQTGIALRDDLQALHYHTW